jgi:hypothetical protein
MPPSANPRNRRRRRTKTRILAIVGPSTNRGVEKKMQNVHSFERQAIGDSGKNGSAFRGKGRIWTECDLCGIWGEGAGAGGGGCGDPLRPNAI